MILLDTLELPDLVWTDEYTSQAVAMTRRRTLDGGQVVFYAGLSAGRAITLESRDDTAWVRKALVDALAALAASPGAIHTLSIRGQAFRVMFRHDEPPAFEAQPLWPLANPGPEDWYLVKLKLVTV